MRRAGRPHEETTDAKKDEEIVDTVTVAPAGPRTGGISRRFFVSNLAGAAIAVTASPLLHAGATATVVETQEPAATGESVGTIPVALNVNGETHRLQIEPRVTLLDALRENLGMFGTKKGCDHGQCGACTVHVNGRRINFC